MAPLIRAAATRYQLPEALLRAVIRAESNFDQNAVSRAGAEGLMQLMPLTAQRMGVTNSFDPQQNIHGGARYLRLMLDRLGKLDLALAAYNAGPEAVEEHGGIPPYRETQRYVPKVLKFYREYGGSVATIASAKPRVANSTIFYYRGPDGQIYLTNQPGR